MPPGFYLINYPGLQIFFIQVTSILIKSTWEWFLSHHQTLSVIFENGIIGFSKYATGISPHKLPGTTNIFYSRYFTTPLKYLRVIFITSSNIECDFGKWNMPPGFYLINYPGLQIFFIQVTSILIKSTSENFLLHHQTLSVILEMA